MVFTVPMLFPSGKVRGRGRVGASSKVMLMWCMTFIMWCVEGGLKMTVSKQLQHRWKIPFLGMKKKSLNICNPEVWKLSSHSDCKKKHTCQWKEQSIQSLIKEICLLKASHDGMKFPSYLRLKNTMLSTPLRQEVLSHGLLKNLMKIHMLRWLKIHTLILD